MERFSVSLDEDQNQWVEGMAEDLNGSKTQVIQMLVDFGREHSSRLAQFPENNECSDDQHLKDQISTLETRISILESIITHSSIMPPDEDSATPDFQIGDLEFKTAEKSGGTLTHIDALSINDDRLSDWKENYQSPANTPGSSGDIAEDLEPDVEEVREYVKLQAPSIATTEEIVSCWILLKNRGTGGPGVFKECCYSQDDSGTEHRDEWWNEGVYPLLTTLPGVESASEDAQLLQYTLK